MSHFLVGQLVTLVKLRIRLNLQEKIIQISD